MSTTTTTNATASATPRGYPLPHPDHLLSDDVLNLREALTRIDADVGGVLIDAAELNAAQAVQTTQTLAAAQAQVAALTRRLKRHTLIGI